MKKKWKTGFIIWRNTYCSVCSMDSFDPDGRRAAAGSERNQYWICNIQLLVSSFGRCQYDNLYDYRLDGTYSFSCMPDFCRYWSGSVIKRRSLFKVDPDIIILGVYYVVVILAYLIFEMISINYRPILINGVMEASYPSSTTLLVLCVMPTLIEQIQRRMSCSTLKRIITILAIAFSAFMVIGRLISGVHWFTDIVGGVLLSAGLFTVYKAVVMLTIKK